MDHITEHDVPDLVRGKLRAAYRLFHYTAGKIGWGKVLQAAAIVANRRTYTAQHHYFASTFHGCLRFCLLLQRAGGQNYSPLLCNASFALVFTHALQPPAVPFSRTTA